MFTNRLRRSLIFGRFGLLRDTPFGRLDLIVCRNTLMYFNADIQARVLARFHFALNGNGYLFLGRAEMLVNHAEAFAPLSTKWRIFRKVGNTTLREPMLPIALPPGYGNNSACRSKTSSR
jgi:two-component system CheB/CheR fusion protein